MLDFPAIIPADSPDNAGAAQLPDTLNDRTNKAANDNRYIA